MTHVMGETKLGEGYARRAMGRPQDWVVKAIDEAQTEPCGMCLATRSKLADHCTNCP